MEYFENLDIKKLLEEDEYYSFPAFTDKDLEETEKTIGWKLPKSYIALLKIQNGGSINYDEFDECWLSTIYGISPSGGLVDMFDNWINEWEYPNIGIPFGETQSAGHDMYFMDFSVVDDNGEPRIVHIDNEADNAIDVVADNLEDFLTKIYNHENV